MSKVYVKVKPRAKEASVERVDPTHFEVAVKEPPVQGKANQAIVKALSDYLNVPVSNLSIVSGVTWRNKVIEIIK